MGSTITGGSVVSETLVIPLATAKQHLRIASTDTTKDDLVTSAINASKVICENYLNRYLLRASRTLRLDAFPDEIELPAPLVSVTSITYLDSTGVSQTLSTDVYAVDTYDEEKVAARITLKYGQSWPTTLEQSEAVTITYTSGWPAAIQLPEPIKVGLLLTIQDNFYGAQTDSYGKPVGGEVIDSMWGPYRRSPI